MSWDYRVIKRRSEKTGDDIYSIHECFFDEEDRVWACTDGPEEALATSLDELRDILIMMLQATTTLTPVVDYDLIPEEGAIDPVSDILDDINENPDHCVKLDWEGWLDSFLSSEDRCVCSSCYHWFGKEGKKRGKCRARPIGVRDS